MKCKAEYNVPQFIPRNIKKKIQQVDLKYVLFSQITNIKGELVVLVEKSSEEKPNKSQTEGKDKSSTKIDFTTGKQSE